MKKNYVTPDAEKIEFSYRGQVVASTTPGGEPPQPAPGCKWGKDYSVTEVPYGCEDILIPIPNSEHWILPTAL